jgi:hypothetical protein
MNVENQSHLFKKIEILIYLITYIQKYTINSKMQAIAPSVSASVSVIIVDNNYYDDYYDYDDTDISMREIRQIKRKIFIGKILSVLFFSFFIFIFMFNILLLLCNSISLANKLETNVFCFNTQLNSNISIDAVIAIVVCYIFNNIINLLINYSVYRTWNKNFDKYLRDKWILYSSFCLLFFLCATELFIGYNRYETKSFVSCFFMLHCVFNLGYAFISIVYSDYLHK